VPLRRKRRKVGYPVSNHPRPPPAAPLLVVAHDTTGSLEPWSGGHFAPTVFLDHVLTTCYAEPEPRGIFGVPLITSIPYANVAISLFNESGESYIYGYVPIVVAKCGVFLKEKGN
jgi:hypothetical protein